MAEIDFLADDALDTRAPPTAAPGDAEADEDAAFIAAAAAKHNIKAGTQVAKQTERGRSKAKVASGVVLSLIHI